MSLTCQAISLLTRAMPCAHKAHSLLPKSLPRSPMLLSMHAHTPLHAHSCPSPCTLSDPGGPSLIRCHAAPCTPGSAGTWGSQQLSDPRLHTHRAQSFPLLMTLHLAGSKAGLLHRAPGTKAKPSIFTVPSLGPKPVSVELGIHREAGKNSDIREQWASVTQETKRPSMVLAPSQPPAAAHRQPSHPAVTL